MDPSPTRRPSTPTWATPPTCSTGSTWSAGSPPAWPPCARIQRREPRGHVTPAFDPEAFRSRFLALRRPDRLGEAEAARLEALFAAHAELGRAWAMLQELHGLYLATDDAAAMECLDRFSRLYADDPLPEFYTSAMTSSPSRSPASRSSSWWPGWPRRFSSASVSHP